MTAFNTIGFTIFGIPSYFFFAVVAFVISVSVFIALLAEKKYSLSQNLRTLFVSVIIMIITARLFGCLSGIYRDIGMGHDVTLDGIISTGIVFYGGLIGLLLSFRILSKHIEQDIHVLDLLAVCIPLFHSVARIGCFFGGCCFGKEAHSFIAINYTTKVFGEAVTTYRIPIQLIEAGFNIMLFLYLLHLIKGDNWKSNSILKRYLFLYSVGRFIIEFFRGDLIRGVICGISFSQIICILIWTYLFVPAWRSYKRAKKEEELLI